MPNTGERALVPVLITEDEVLIRMMVADELLDAGFRPLEAGTADEALQILDARSDVRVLVTDVKMPGSLDGFALAGIVAGRWPHIGIVVTSGHALPGDAPLPPGAVFLGKPYRMSMLVEVVRQLARETESKDAGLDPASAIIVPADNAAADALTSEPIAGDTVGANARASEGESEA
jgi:DNA-binding NtrC family response regulator